MKILSDETLNKYIVGELNREEMRETEEIIKGSGEDRIRFNAIVETDRSLRDLKVIEVKPNFTSLLMNKIQRSLQSNQEQKKFILGVISVFIIMCLAIVGIVGFEIIRDFNPGAFTVIKESIKYMTSVSEFIANLLNNKNLSILGSAFSFGLIIFAWFFFDYNKILRKAGK